MSNLEAELEEGEISDSDSDGVGEQAQRHADPAKPPARQYSIFDDPPSSAALRKPTPRPPRSESDSSDSDNHDDYDDDDDGVLKKRKYGGDIGSLPSKAFINPNYAQNGGSMPPLPRQSNKTIWGSVLQEQILTADVGSFSMEKKVVSDRDVESYDYTRAKDDDRPFLEVEEEDMKEDELFGEVIDLEGSTLKQQRTLKRKHVGDRLGQRRGVKERLEYVGKRQGVKERLELPEVSDSSSVEEVTHYISTTLHEAKVHLIRRVVQTLGQAKALALLRTTEDVESAGGMMTMNGSRRRTAGGVYLTLLKTDSQVTKQQVDAIFEEETQWSLDLRKRKKARARRRKREQSEQKARMADADSKGEHPGSMEVTEEGHSRSSVEGQTGSPRNPADHLSDTQDSCGGGEGEVSSDGDDHRTSHREDQDFEAQLARELQRHTAAREAAAQAEAGGSTDAVTVDDVLDIGVDVEFID